MITNKDLFEKYGSDIVFLFKGNEPYTERNGYPLGVLIEKDNKVLCNECGAWVVFLTRHLKKHKMDTKDYREKYGFNRNSPLCPRYFSQIRSEVMKDTLRNPESRKIMMDKLEEGHRLMKENNPNKNRTRRMQTRNTFNTCPEQIKQRMMMIVSRYGENIGLPTIQKIDSGLITYATKNYGTWNNFKKSLGLKLNPITGYEKRDKAKLIYDLRNYVAENKSLPWSFKNNTTTKKDGFPYSLTQYTNEWGSMKRAMLACGVIRNGFLTNKGQGVKKEWSLIN